MTLIRLFKSIAGLTCFILLFPVSPALSQEMPPGVDVMPASSLTSPRATVINPALSTHPQLRLTPDKSEIVRLDVDAVTVIIGNPNHLSVLAENSRTLVLVPKAPGATYFTALDNKSNVLMQRHVIVAAPQNNYIRIRKSCAASKGNCQETQVYYCPDMCHEIMMDGDSADAGSQQSAETSPSGIYTPAETTEMNEAEPASQEVGSDAATETPAEP